MNGHEIAANTFAVIRCSGCWNVALDPTSQFLVGEGWESNQFFVKTWNVADQRLLGHLEFERGDNPLSSSVAISPNGDVLAISRVESISMLFNHN